MIVVATFALNVAHPGPVLSTRGLPKLLSSFDFFRHRSSRQAGANTTGYEVVQGTNAPLSSKSRSSTSHIPSVHNSWFTSSHWDQRNGEQPTPESNAQMSSKASTIFETIAAGALRVIYMPFSFLDSRSSDRLRMGRRTRLGRRESNHHKQGTGDDEQRLTPGMQPQF